MTRAANGSTRKECLPTREQQWACPEQLSDTNFLAIR